MNKKRTHYASLQMFSFIGKYYNEIITIKKVNTGKRDTDINVFLQ